MYPDLFRQTANQIFGQMASSSSVWTSVHAYLRRRIQNATIDTVPRTDARVRCATCALKNRDVRSSQRHPGQKTAPPRTSKAPAPAAAQDRSQQRKQLLDLAAEHAKLLSVLIADWAGDAGAAATPRDDGPAVRLPPIENRRPAPVDTGRHAHADLATPLPDLTPIATPRGDDAAAGPASLWSRRKPLPAHVTHATPARPKTPPRPQEVAAAQVLALEPKPARPAAVPAPRDAVRRRLRADVAARLRASRASSSDLRSSSWPATTSR